MVDVEIEEFLEARYAEEAKRWQTIWRFEQGDRRIDGWWDLGGTLGYAVQDVIDTTRGGREVAAKRKRLALYLEAKRDLEDVLKGFRAEETPANFHTHADQRRKREQAAGRFIAFETSVKLDAMAYQDHADFDPRWKVDDGD